MSAFLDALAERVLLADGAIGTQVQARDLELERDFLGCENCTEVLNKSRPDLVREIHSAYLSAGADLIETNSFGGSPLTLAEFGLDGEAFEINRRAAELAREAVEAFSGDGRRRFVLGAVGPGTKLPSLGQIDYRSLEDALVLQCRGLAAGGIDAFLTDLGPEAGRVTVVAMTEFGRRLRENTSFGTDHGSGSTLFVIGPGALPTGLAGKVTSGWSDLSSDQLDEVGDVPAAINYRGILAPVLEAHSPGVDLAAVFPGHTFKTPASRNMSG